MIQKHFFIAIISIGSAFIRVEAQNLILNPNFEDVELLNKEVIDSLPLLFGKPTQAVSHAFSFPHWNNPNCYPNQQFAGYNNQKDFDKKKHGILFLGDQQRFYLEGDLAAPLKSDSTYRFSFHVTFSLSYEIRKEKIGVVFSEKRLHITCPSPVLNLPCSIYTVSLDSLIKDQFRHRKFFSYTKISLDLVASGNEQHFIIGNFNNDLPSGMDKRYMIIYVDDFSLEQIKGSPNIYQKITNPAFHSIPAGDSLVFNYILFDFDKFIIRDDAFIYLQKLKDYFFKESGLNLSIKAYTDSIGSNIYNNLLSEKRADAVIAYFIQNGFPSSRIKKKAYGENFPIADNATEEGRRLNRRVEFTFYNKK